MWVLLHFQYTIWLNTYKKILFRVEQIWRKWKLSWQQFSALVVGVIDLLRQRKSPLIRNAADKLYTFLSLLCTFCLCTVAIRRIALTVVHCQLFPILLLGALWRCAILSQAKNSSDQRCWPVRTSIGDWRVQSTISHCMAKFEGMNPVLEKWRDWFAILILQEVFASQSICLVWSCRPRVWWLYCVELRGLLCNFDFTGGGSLFWLHRGRLSILTLSPLSLLTTPIPQDCIDSDEDDSSGRNYRLTVLKKRSWQKLSILLVELIFSSTFNAVIKCLDNHVARP